MGKLDETVRTNLRAIREERGFTQEELSDRCDLAPQNVGELERGKKLLTAEDLLRFAVELETRVSDFFVNNGQPEEHARSVDRQPYNLGTLIEPSEDDAADPPSPDLESLFDTSENILVLLDENGSTLEANEKYRSLTKTNPGEDQGKPFWESPLWFEANQRRVKHLIDEARGGEFLREVLPARTPRGSTRPMSLNICPILSDDSTPVRLLVEGSIDEIA